MSWTLKSQITLRLVSLDKIGKFPIWYVNELQGSWIAVCPWELTKSILLIENSSMNWLINIANYNVLSLNHGI